RAQIDARLDEYEARVLLRLLRHSQQIRWPRRCREESRQREHAYHAQEVDDDRKEDPFTPRDRPLDAVKLGPVVLEIEIHQGLTIISCGPRPPPAARRVPRSNVRKDDRLRPAA